MPSLFTPLQIPGGIELFVIALIILIPLVFILAVVAGVVFLIKFSTADGDAGDVDERLASLEGRVARLEDRVHEDDR